MVAQGITCFPNGFPMVPHGFHRSDNGGDACMFSPPPGNAVLPLGFKGFPITVARVCFFPTQILQFMHVSPRFLKDSMGRVFFPTFSTNGPANARTFHVICLH